MRCLNNGLSYIIVSLLSAHLTVHFIKFPTSPPRQSGGLHYSIEKLVRNEVQIKDVLILKKG